VPFLECGKILVNGREKHRLFAVPKIYNGTLKFIDETKFNPDPSNNVLFWNKLMPYSEEAIWTKHKNWSTV